jgi:hypothetical protein
MPLKNEMTMRRYPVLLLLSMLSMTARSVQADTPSLTLNSGPARVSLIELYTSEGCSSCPAADKWLGRLEHDAGFWREFVPLAFHVDYWNYLGWKDSFADAKYSGRQRTYKRQGGIDAVYTPGFVIDGQEWRGFFQRSTRPAKSEERPGNLQLSMAAGEVTISFNGLAAASASTAHLVLLGNNLQSSIRGGENRGKELRHHFVVLDYQSIGAETGPQASKWRFKVHPTGSVVAIAAWVSYADQQTPVQVVGGWLGAS